MITRVIFAITLSLALGIVTIATISPCNAEPFTTDNGTVQVHATQVLAKAPTTEPPSRHSGSVNHEDPDGQSVANNPGPQTDHHPAPRLSPLDWIVVALYAFVVLGIGWFYSRRTRSTQDYLLGGRRIGSASLGLSLFATMLSAITYLALPGEIIKYGPVFVVGRVAAYPFIALIVGWFIIPQIMKLNATTAYEILETRLGLSVRMLGSTFFLMLRLTWMSVIVYATCSKVLVPLLGLDESATPYFCGLLGAITVAYTSMGGLRAVVLTDVIQTSILFVGVLLVLGLITYALAGFGSWWPTEWLSHWPQFKWGYDPNPDVRTFVGVFLATLLWYVCTQGADQMAVQRFLASRDVGIARKTLIWSLVCSASAAILLTLVGLAVLAYFQTNPDLVPKGEGLLANADSLFPWYIASGLPSGVSGLIMAALLAAAMSSLSSGINSSCSVITVDFLDRFKKRKQDEAHRIRSNMAISAAVGIVVILLSMLVGMIEGNLLAIAFKVCNLLTAPPLWTAVYGHVCPLGKGPWHVDWGGLRSSGNRGDQLLAGDHG